jgi:hypothetical protein
MRTLMPTAETPAPALPPDAAGIAQLLDARIAVVFDDGSCLLGSGQRARRALSCLVEPEAGDRVLASVGGDGLCHVLHVLGRADAATVRLSAPGADAIALRQRRIALHAGESLRMGSAGDASITAAGGTLALEGRNVFMTAVDGIVEQAAHMIGKFGQYLLDASQLLRLHGEHALITAARDVKIDGERISMG